MPVSDLDIWRSANEMIKLHREDAWTEAVVRYVELQKQGDREGMDVWRRIARAIDEFTSPKVGPHPN